MKKSWPVLDLNCLVKATTACHILDVVKKLNLPMPDFLLSVGVGVGPSEIDFRIQADEAEVKPWGIDGMR